MAGDVGAKDSAPTTAAAAAPPTPTPPPASDAARAKPPPAPGAAGAASGEAGGGDFFDPSFVQSLLGQVRVWIDVYLGCVGVRLCKRVVAKCVTKDAHSRIG